MKDEETYISRGKIIPNLGGVSKTCTFGCFLVEITMKAISNLCKVKVR